MKKLKYYIPALVIILAGITFSTTSCVDDSESQSVTDLRTAQAEKIKAEAALATAQAKAEEIRAAAEAALAEAQAEAAKADAKLKEAEAARIAAKTEAEKKEAEVAYLKAQEELREAKAQADLAVKQAEYDLEAMRIESEMKLLALQQELEKLKNDDPVLQQAIDDYSRFIGQVNSLKIEIANQELKLTKDKALLVDAKAGYEESAATQIKYLNQDIANWNLNINANKLEIENWNTLLSKGGNDLEADIEKLVKERDDLIYNKSADLLKIRKEKEEAKDAARKEVLNFRDLGTVNYSGGYAGYLYELTNVTYFTIGDLNIQIKEKKADIKSNEDNLAELKEEYSKAENELEDLHTAWKNAIKATEDASTAYDEARDKYYEVIGNPSSTQEQIDAAADAMNDAQTALNDAYDAQNQSYVKYQDAKNIVDQYPAIILNTESYINFLKNDLTNLTTAVEAYGTDAEAPRKLENAYKAAYEAYVEASDNYDSLTAEIYALNNTINELKIIQNSEGYWDVDLIKSIIEGLENTNSNLEDNIAEAKRTINEVTESNKVDIAKLDLDIQKLEAEIAKLKVELNVAQKQADNAQAVIDAKTK